MVLFLLKAIGAIAFLTRELNVLFYHAGEYIRLAYRSVNPRPLRDVSGDVALVTGAGGLYSSIGYLWGPASVFFGPRKKKKKYLWVPASATGNH